MPTDFHGRAWHFQDNRGYLDAGLPCDVCDDCECPECPKCNCTICTPADVALFVGKSGYQTCDHRRILLSEYGYTRDEISCDGAECIGLSCAWTCLDGGDTLCESCFEREGIQFIHEYEIDPTREVSELGGES